MGGRVVNKVNLYTTLNSRSEKDEFTANCRYCYYDFTVKYEGISAVNAHKGSKSHKSKSSSAKMSKSMTQFVTKINTKDAEEVTVSELCLTYTINHYLSYNQ